MPALKPGEVYKRGPHKGMTKGSAKKEYKTHVPSHSKSYYADLEKKREKGEHHVHIKPHKHSKEDLKAAAKHMKMHGG